LPGEALASATTLPNELSAAAVAELMLEMLELGRAPAPSEIAGLVRRADGRTWLLAHHEPLISRDELGANVDRPWVHPIGLRFKTLYGKIADVAAILLDPDSGHAEVKRRQALHEEMEREAHERRERNLAEQRAAGAAQVEERRREEQAKRDFDYNRWCQLPREARWLYLVALAADSGKPLAQALRDVADAVARGDAAPFPGAKWW
jgi:hypothetical protein